MHATPQTPQTNKKPHKPTPKTAKVFMNGRSQAVRLPAQFRFDTEEVYIRQDEKTGDVILSKRPNDWDEFFAYMAQLTTEERQEIEEVSNILQAERERARAMAKTNVEEDIFAGWEE